MRNKFSSRLDAEVPGVHSRAEVEEGRRVLCRKILGAERTLVTAGEGLECSRLEDLPGFSGEKRDRASTAPLALHCR